MWVDDLVWTQLNFKNCGIPYIMRVPPKFNFSLIWKPDEDSLGEANDDTNFTLWFHSQILIMQNLFQTFIIALHLNLLSFYSFDDDTL